MKILIADDEVESREVLFRRLEAAGYAVTAVSNGAYALRKLRKEKFDLVISDLLMPVMDGFQLCHTVKIDEALKSTPVIIYTATYTEPKDEALVKNLGANAFVVKPADYEVFLRQIREIIEMAERGELPATRVPTPDEAIYLREYAQRLVSKLEAKVEEVQTANQRLAEANQNLAEINATLSQRVEQAVAHLRESNHELEAFAYSVSHDLRAPLRAIQGMAAILFGERNQGLSEEQKMMLDRIRLAVQQMDALIEDLLAYSRLNGTEIRLTRVSLEAVVERAIEDLAHPIRDSKAEVRFRKPMPSVLAFESVLVQVVTNLLGNAIKFVPRGTQPLVEISSHEENGWFRLSIKDNGIGIPADYQARIFEVFERLHDNSTYPGTGIGLAIVRKGIQRMGGRSGVDSEPAKGSTFWFELPRA